ncbi:hypothetical protein BD309DRAFT_825181, partial [Dichomitus squalens]
MSSVKLGDDYVRVPKLDVGGSNWVLYKERLTWAADAKGLVGHLDGTSIEPVAPPSPAGTSTTAPVGGTATGLATWKKGEAIVKQLIASTIPDSLFMKVRAKGTARAIWQALASEFEKRSRMVSLDL